MDRGPLGFGKTGIDAAGHLIKRLFEILIIRDQGSARHHQLHQTDFGLQLGVFFQSPLKSQETFGDPLGIVEPIHPQNQLPTPQILMQIPGSVFHLAGACAVVEFVKVNADWKVPDPYGASFKAQHIVLALATEHLNPGQQGGRSMDEVTPVAQGLKAEQIVSQQRLEQWVPPGQTAEKIGRRKRNMQEKTERLSHL